MIVAAEGAGADAGLAARLSVPSSRLAVSAEGLGRCAGSVGSTAATFGIPSSVPVHSARYIRLHAALATRPVVIASVVKRVAPGVVPLVVIDRVSVMPIEAPMPPAPPETSKEANPETDSEREKGAAVPNSRIRAPTGPRQNGTSVDQPRIISGDVNDIRVRGLNDDR